MEYYSTIKNNEIIPLTATWMDLEIIILSEESQKKTNVKDGLVGSPCSPRDSQESSSTPQFKSLNSSAFPLLYSPTLTSIRTKRQTLLSNLIEHRKVVISMKI